MLYQAPVTLIEQIDSMHATTGINSRYVPMYEGASRTVGRYYGDDRVFAWVLCLVFTWITPRYMEGNFRHAVQAIEKSERVLRRKRPRSR